MVFDRRKKIMIEILNNPAFIKTAIMFGSAKITNFHFYGLKESGMHFNLKINISVNAEMNFLSYVFLNCTLCLDSTHQRPALQMRDENFSCRNQE